jgi:hypothetical protein
MARRIDREGPIHRAIIRYLRAQLPVGAIIHHSPNEGVRGGRAGAIDGKRRKEMGQLAGFPDIFIMLGDRCFFVEVKAEGNGLTKDQRAFRDHCKAQGVPFAVCRSIDDAAETLREWGLI